MKGKDLKAGMVFYSMEYDVEPDDDIDDIDFMELVQTSLVISDYNGNGRLYYVSDSVSVNASKEYKGGTTNVWCVIDDADYAMTKEEAIIEKIDIEEKYGKNALRVAEKLRAMLDSR